MPGLCRGSHAAERMEDATAEAPAAAAPTGTSAEALAAVGLVFDAGVPLQTHIAAARVCKSWKQTEVESMASSMQTLDLRPYASEMTDEAFARIIARVPLLRELNLSGCSKLSDAALAHLRPESLPLLCDLNLTCVPSVTAAAVGAVADAYGSKLVALELSGCVSISEADLVSRFSRFLELDDDEDGLGACQG